MDNTFNKKDMYGPALDTRTIESDNHKPEPKSSSLSYNSAVRETTSITLSPRFDSDTIFSLESDQNVDWHHKEPLDDQDYSELYGSSSSSYNSALSEIGSFTISTCLNRDIMQNLEYSDDENIGLHRNPSSDGQETSDVSGSSSLSYTSALSHMDSYMLSPCLNEDFELENDVFDDLDFKCMLPQDNQGTSDIYGSSSLLYYSASSETGCMALSACLNLDKIQDLSDEDRFEDVELNRKFPLDAHQNEESTPVCNVNIQTHYGDNQEIGHDSMDDESYCCSSVIACERQENQVDKQASLILESQKGEEIQCYAGIPVSTLDYDPLNTDNYVPLCKSVGAGGSPDEQGDNLGLSTARVQAVANRVIPPKHDPRMQFFPTVISDPKQIKMLLDQAKRAISASQIHYANTCITRAYESLGAMANQMEDSFVALGYETCSDIFKKIGRIAMAVRSFYQGIKYSSNWEESKMYYLWTQLSEAFDFVDAVMHEVRPLLEELEQISVELERDEKWDKCCFVSRNLFDLYVKADSHNLWNYQLIMTSEKRMVLRMARCTYQTKDFASVNQNCKFVLEQLCEYDCVEALTLWAKSLWKTKKYDVAIKKAVTALECCKSEAERQIIKRLIDDVHQSREQEQPEENLWEWLEGTNVVKHEEERHRIEEARRRYRKKIKRCRQNSSNHEDSIPQPSEALTRETTQSSHSTVLETDLLYERTRSPSSIPLSETILEGSSTSSDNDTNASNSSASLSARSISDKIGKKSQKQKNTNLSGINTKILGNIVTWTGSIISKQRSLSLNIENLEDVHWSESDDDIKYSSSRIDSSTDEDKAKTHIRDHTNIDDDEVSYFERSRIFFNKQNDVSAKEEMNMTKMLQTGLELDIGFLKKFTTKPQRPPFYEEELSEGELQKRIKEQPNRYKKCYFQIKFVHLAYCTPVDQNDDIKKIEIFGRSKAGQALSDDIVWVEILDKEYLSTQEAKVFGKVVKIIKRNRKANTKHPVYACTIDNIESHLMKPICNTLPKIHVLNQNILSKCPKLKKYQVELHKYDPVSKELEFERLINIPPEKRNSFVFLVVYMGWTRHHVYPRGAVIKVLLCADDLDSSNDLDSGIKLLDIQYEVPGLYSSQTVEHIENIMSRHVDAEPTVALRVGRKDLTSMRIFTIDPPGSTDLDDALSVEEMVDGYRVGVHISDVTAFVQKRDPVDIEAQQRVTTFYSGVRSPHHMIPEPLSQNLCSLLPGKCRLCISLSFNMAKDGSVVGQPSIKKTVIRSSKRFTYEEVQDIINKTSTESDQGIREDIDIINKTSTESDQGVREDIDIINKTRTELDQCVREDIDIINKTSTESDQGIREDIDIINKTSIESDQGVREDIDIINKTSIESDQGVREDIDIINKTSTESDQGVREDIDTIIKTSTESDQGVREDIGILFRLATLMRKARLGNSMYALKVELDDETDKDELSKTLEAHYLVEEFMILANKTVAEILTKKFPDLVPLRCQNPPPNGELQNWLERHREIVDLLLCLQDRHILNDKRPSIESINGHNSQLLIPVQENVFHILHSLPSPKAIKCMKTDGLHPLQYLAHQEWLQIQECTDYRCSGSLKNISKEGKHFRLEMCPYTHFTSPIRRYVDQIVHRLLGCVIDGKESTYTQKEVEELCVRINTVTQRAKAYQKNCTSLTFAVKLKQKPSLFYCYVSNVTDRSVSFCTPALRFVHRSFKELPFNLLGISTKPTLKQDTQTSQDIVTVEWQKCLYEVGVSSTVTRGISRIDPNQHVVYVPYKDWVHALQSALRKNADDVFETFRNITPTLYRLPSSHDTVIDVSMETYDSTMKGPHSISTTFAYGQVIKFQMMATVQKGILAPCLQLYDMTKNFKCCLQHIEDPIKCLCYYSTKPTFEWYPDVKQYLYRWIPLVMMEAATSSIHNEGGFTICNLPVTFSERTGQFRLQTAFCFEHNIEISGHGAYGLAEETDDTVENETQEESDSTSHDWLCIRHKEPEKQDSLAPSSIWVAHGQIKNFKKITQQDEVSVHFEICNLSTVPSDNEEKECTVEFLIKSDVDRRTEIYLKSLKRASDLAKKIALNRKILDLDKGHQDLGKRLIDKEELNVGNLPRNNTKQIEAITKALTSRFSLIQGPPGTGKSYTGIKLLYLFNKINKLWEKEGNPRKQVLFCGPSNNSVDQIARWMKNRLLEHCPNIVRMYGRSIEAVDFPIPGKTFLSKRSMRDSTAAEDLTHISLHHLIREKSKPFAEEINAFDKRFQLPDYIPDHKEVQKYVHLLSVATVKEMKTHDVILCTTAVASNNKLLKGTDIYQIIIDEAAMCPEPQCLVPIIATKAEQVVLIGDHKQLQPIIMCKEAAELGLEKSLFERYAKSQYRDKNNIQYTPLEIQYRMHPRICDFPSKEFYDNKLKTAKVNFWKEGYKRKGLNGQSGQWISCPLKMWPHENYTHVFCHIVGQEEVLTVSTEEGNEYSRSNTEEVKQVVKVFSHMVKSEKVNSNRICVISQYNAQCHKLRKELQGFQSLNVNTVVGSQGGEWDYVIFSTVRSLPEFKIEKNPTLGWCKHNLGYITDHHQINVALNRAKKGIIIVGNQNLLQCDEVWKRLICLYKQRGCVKTAEEFP